MTGRPPGGEILLLGGPRRPVARGTRASGPREGRRDRRATGHGRKEGAAARAPRRSTSVRPRTHADRDVGSGGEAPQRQHFHHHLPRRRARWIQPDGLVRQGIVREGDCGADRDECPWDSILPGAVPGHMYRVRREDKASRVCGEGLLIPLIRLSIEQHPDEAEPYEDHRHGVCPDPFRTEQVPRAVCQPPAEVEHNPREKCEEVETEGDGARKGDFRHDASKGPPSKNLYPLESRTCERLSAPRDTPRTLGAILPSRLRRLPAERGDRPGKATARPRPPCLDPRIRAGVLLDPKEERKEKEEHREDDQEVERPPRDRLLDAECGIGPDPIDAVHAQEACEHREVDVPPAVREITRIRRRDLGGLPLRAAEEAERHHPESSRVAADIPIELEPKPNEVRRLGENRSEEHTSELQSQSNLVCRLLLEKKKKKSR